MAEIKYEDILKLKGLDISRLNKMFKQHYGDEIGFNPMKTYMGTYRGSRATYSPYVATELSQKIIGDIVQREGITPSDYGKMLIRVETQFIHDDFEVTVRIQVARI